MFRPVKAIESLFRYLGELARSLLQIALVTVIGIVFLIGLLIYFGSGSSAPTSQIVSPAIEPPRVETSKPVAPAEDRVLVKEHYRKKPKKK